MDPHIRVGNKVSQKKKKKKKSGQQRVGKFTPKIGGPIAMGF